MRIFWVSWPESKGQNGNLPCSCSLFTRFAQGEDEKTDHGHHEDGHVHERHSDFKAHYQFFCNKPEKLAYLDVMLLRIFPGIERIEVQILTDTGQTVKELTAKDYRITF